MFAAVWLMFAAKVYQGLRETDKAVWNDAEIWRQSRISASTSSPHLWRDGQLPRHLVY